ncbi:helix-turn-helix domain-containing protein [Streptomyces sp. NBC_00433]
MTEGGAVEAKERGLELRGRRTAAGISLRQFAAQLGIGAQRLSEYETGRRKMPVELCSRARALLDDLAAGRGLLGLEAQSVPPTGEHPLAALRRAQGWTLRDLARLLARILGGADDRQKIWRWEHWGVVPDRPSQLALAQLLGVQESVVLARPWPTWLPGTDGADVDSPWNLRGVLAALDATGEAAMDRRGFLTISSAALAGMAERLGTAAPRVPGVLPEGAETGSADDVVTTFESRLPLLRHQENLYGGGVVLAGISAELATARQMLNWPLGCSARLRLLKVTAELSRLGGWAAFDAGRRAAAETYFVAALRAARETGDASAAANTIKTFSLLLIESERPEDAQRLLAAGRQAAAQSPLRVQAMVATRQARVEAVLGNATACQARLCEATDLMERSLDRDDHPPQASYFGPGELAAQTAASHQILGRHASTVGLLETALSSQPDSRPRDRATYQLWLCRSALTMGDLDRACDLLSDETSGISAAASTASARNQALMKGVREQLARHRDHPAARAVDERLRDLVA